MTTYSSEFIDSILTKLLPPNNVGVSQLAQETGIPRDTLYRWRSAARGQSARTAGIHASAGHPQQSGEVRRGAGDG